MATMVKGTDEQLTHALGAGVVQIWSYLPPDVQHELFEEATTCLGERMRHQLALFLHDRHVRTDFGRAACWSRTASEANSSFMTPT